MKGQGVAPVKRKVLIVDDHPIVRNGLALLINQERDLTVCGEADRASTALTAVTKTRPDVVIMDISIEGTNGIEVTKSIHRFSPTLPVLILSMHEEEVYAERALRAGARGYLTKQEAAETVLKALRTVLDGDLFVSNRLSSKLLLDLASGRPRHQGMGVDRLTDRELEIFELIGHGFSTAEIAKRLIVSIKTVECHRGNIRQKLKLTNAREVVHRATRWVETKKAGS